MLNKTTHTYSNPGIALECDVYEADGSIPSTPVLLFFHSGGLVGGARSCIPPWLAQVCYQRQWPLISASYRLLPQAGGEGLRQDAAAAYHFATSWKVDENTTPRKVIVAGASAGFFMACLAACNANQPPIALLCITGIPTFHHTFFHSNTLLTPEPIEDEEMVCYINSAVEVGTTPEYNGTIFNVARLLPSGLRNPEYCHPKRPEDTAASVKWERGALYDYYLYKNQFPVLLGSVDPGFEWAGVDQERLKAWPTTIFIQGDEDYDVSPDLVLDTVEKLGSNKAKLFLAHKQGHLFEATSFLEDDAAGMDVVRSAIKCLDELVNE